MAKKRYRRGGNSTTEEKNGDSRNSSDIDRNIENEPRSSSRNESNGSSNDSGDGGGNGNNNGNGNGNPRRRRRRSGGGNAKNSGNNNNGNSNRRRRNGGNGGGGNNNNNSNRGNRNNNNNSNRSRRGNREPVEFDDAELIDGYGMLEMHPNGYGFLRSPENNYSREKSDPFVPGTMIEKYNLRAGLMLTGRVQPARRQQGPRLRELIDVDGKTPDEYLEVRNFDQLTPINPEQWYQLETGPEPITTRVMDLLTPMGKGQRALIVAPPSGVSRLARMTKCEASLPSLPRTVKVF